MALFVEDLTSQQAAQAADRILAQKQMQQKKAAALLNLVNELRRQDLSIPTIAVLSVLSCSDATPSSFDQLAMQAQKLTPRQQFCRGYFRPEGCGSKSCEYNHDASRCHKALCKLNDFAQALKASKMPAEQNKETEKKEFCWNFFKRAVCKLGDKCPHSHDEKAYVKANYVKKCPQCNVHFCHQSSSECQQCYLARRAENDALMHPCANQSKGCPNVCIAEICRECRAAPKFCYGFFDDNQCTRKDCPFSHDESLYMKVNGLKKCPECKDNYCKDTSDACSACRHVKSLHPCATKDCKNRCKAEYCQECNAAYKKEQQKKKDKKDRRDKGPMQCINFPKYCSNKNVLNYRGECDECRESQSIYVVRS